METRKIRVVKVDPDNKLKSLVKGPEFDVGVMEDLAAGSSQNGVTLWVIYLKDISTKFFESIDFTETNAFSIHGYHTLTSNIAGTFEEAVEAIKKLFPEEEFEIEVVSA